MLHLKASQYGISNRVKLFILGKKFILDKCLPYDIKLARLQCREYLDLDILCVLVEFSDRFALYLDANMVDRCKE